MHHVVQLSVLFNHPLTSLGYGNCSAILLYTRFVFQISKMLSLNKATKRNAEEGAAFYKVSLCNENKLRR